MLNWRFGRKKSLFERWSDRISDLAEEAGESLDRATEGATEAATEAAGATARAGRRAGERLGESGRRAGERVAEAGRWARAGYDVGRERLGSQVDALRRRAAEIRDRRALEWEQRRERARARRLARRPLQVDVGDSDRVVLRGRRPVDVRTGDGDVIRYRYGKRPSPLRRLLIRLAGHEVYELR